jgi:hypothetical protein
MFTHFAGLTLILDLQDQMAYTEGPLHRLNEWMLFGFMWAYGLYLRVRKLLIK